MLTPLDLTKPVSMARFTPEQREAERLEIARLTKEWEKKNGKVKTLPLRQATEKTWFNNSQHKKGK